VPFIFYLHIFVFEKFPITQEKAASIETAFSSESKHSGNANQQGKPSSKYSIGHNHVHQTFSAIGCVNIKGKVFGQAHVDENQTQKHKRQVQPVDL
jgi:hypothetical protein